jgi:hypothetical protein
LFTETKQSFAMAPAKGLPSYSRGIPERTKRKRRHCLKACLTAFDTVKNSDDPILKDNAINEMKNHLQALWEQVEGNSDSEAFEEMINVLQIALCTDNNEFFTPNRLEAIHSVLVTLYDEPDLDDQVANDLTQDLIRGGIDVFREIE